MKTPKLTLNCIVSLMLMLAAIQSPVCGSEPQTPRSIVEKARMATHVVVGKMESIRVIDRATGKVIADPGDTLGDMQCFEAIVVVDDIIANNAKQPLHTGAHVKVRFGSRRSDTLTNNKLRIAKDLIYWLSMDEEIAARDNFFFPFYGETNLCELSEKRAIVEAAVAKVELLAK